MWVMPTGRCFFCLFFSPFFSKQALNKICSKLFILIKELIGLIAYLLMSHTHTKIQSSYHPLQKQDTNISWVVFEYAINPWGTSEIVGILVPEFGTVPHSSLNSQVTCGSSTKIWPSVLHHHWVQLWSAKNE